LTGQLLDKRETRIRRMFAGIANRYDLLNHLLSLNVDRSWRRRVTRLVPVRHGPLLDVCTGTGDLAFAYDAAAGGAAPIVGADFCHEMLVKAVEKSRRGGSGERMQFIEADAQRLPFADNTFEVVTVAFGLRNLTDPEQGIREMARVTRPGGHVAILEFSRPRHWLFGRLYRYYFRLLLPLIGQMFARSPEHAYSYLPASALEFPDGEELAAQLRAHGLADVHYERFTLGIASLYVGTKV